MTDPALPLRGRTAIVSGSGRGIGREIALKLASQGAAVVVNDLDAEPAKETVAAVEAAGGQAVACVGSVTESGFAEQFVGTAVESFGGLDIIVNNAGYTWDAVIQKMTDEQFDAILDVHLKAPFRILRAAQPVISARSSTSPRSPARPATPGRPTTPRRRRRSWASPGPSPRSGGATTSPSTASRSASSAPASPRHRPVVAPPSTSAVGNSPSGSAPTCWPRWNVASRCAGPARRPRPRVPSPCSAPPSPTTSADRPSSAAAGSKDESASRPRPHRRAHRGELTCVSPRRCTVHCNSTPTGR